MPVRETSRRNTSAFIDLQVPALVRLRKLVSVSGILVSLLGAVMYLLLGELRSETFRSDLPPYLSVASAAVVLGALLFAVGLVLPESGSRVIDVQIASRYMTEVALANAFLAALFAIPVLIPSLEFPILITRWPGIYMVMAFFLFVTLGVLGSFSWAALFRWLPDLFHKSAIRTPLFFFQLAGLEVGICVMSLFMFWGGYVGASLVQQRAGDAVVGTAMEFAVIPSALGIFLTVSSTLVGLLNTLVFDGGLHGR